MSPDSYPLDPHFGESECLPDLHRILFVCLGNICRSPAAEIILRQMAAMRGEADAWEVDSCGCIGAHRGSMPDPRMRNALEQAGFSYDGHRARVICADDLDQFDLLIVMDEENRQAVQKLAERRAAGDPERLCHYEAKIRLFRHYFPEDQLSRYSHVPDPYYGGQRGFEEVVELLRLSCDQILDSGLHRAE